MQPGCEHTRSASKRVLRRGRAEMRAPWIGPAMAIGPLLSRGGTGRQRYVARLQPRLGRLYFRGAHPLARRASWMEPEEGIEPSTTRLRSECSAAELLRRSLH